MKNQNQNFNHRLFQGDDGSNHSFRMNVQEGILERYNELLGMVYPHVPKISKERWDDEAFIWGKDGVSHYLHGNFYSSLMHEAMIWAYGNMDIDIFQSEIDEEYHGNDHNVLIIRFFYYES